MSLRARLICALGLIAVVLVASGAAILGLVRTSLVDEIDRQLSATAPIAAGPLSGPMRAAGPPPLGDPAGPSSPFTDLFIGEVAGDGTVTVLLRPAGGAAPEIDATAARARATDPARTRSFDAASVSGAAFRAVAVQSVTGRVVVLALPTDRVDATYQRVRLGVIVVAVGLLGALALAGWWVERLGVRPIKRVTDAATAIAGGDLEHRVEPQPPHTEAGQLAQAFNVMVDERQASEQQLRQFVADASHELRTPLATVAGVLELHQAGALPAGPELDEALRRATQETARMSGLVADLLLLAHLDQGRPLDVQPVDVGVIVADAAFDASLYEPGRTITTNIAPDSVVAGDDQKLRQVVTNLVANAMAVTPLDGHIALETRTLPDVCVIEVRDDGPGMTADQAAHAFDRFFRGDAGRSRARGGTGLGLSIVASIVAAHHGDVSVETAPGRGATFRVALPRVAPG